jgi:probable rRNA maturation factor
LNKQISFFAADIPFALRKRTELRKWISSIIRKEGYTLSSLNYIFCSDAYLLDLNIRHLRHHTLTDIITFDLSSSKKNIEGEIYISMTRVKENAAIYKVPLSHELHRVIIHGALHLCGYKDKKPAEQKQMRAKEDYYLNMFSA